LLERVEIWVRDPVLRVTQNLEWVSCLGLHRWRQSYGLVLGQMGLD
jgi:hypothetical protein